MSLSLAKKLIFISFHWDWKSFLSFVSLSNFRVLWRTHAATATQLSWELRKEAANFVMEPFFHWLMFVTTRVVWCQNGIGLGFDLSMIKAVAADRQSWAENWGKRLQNLRRLLILYLNAQWNVSCLFTKSQICFGWYFLLLFFFTHSREYGPRPSKSIGIPKASFFAPTFPKKFWAGLA